MVQPSFERVVRLDSLSEAWSKVKGNRGGPGGDGVTIGDFDRNALERLNRLRLDALSGAYWPGPMRHLRVEKPSGGWRPLAIPCIADRVLQTATAIAFTPLFEAEFEPVSYGYRPNRSVAMAVSRVASLRRQGFVWTVDADIKRYFENVPHALLITRLSALVQDERLVDLTALWLDHAEPDGVGLAQGSPLSPILANLYLDTLDEALESKSVRMVRFADDFVLLCKSEAHALAALADAQETLERLGLSLNMEKTRVRAYGESLHFLGRLFVRSLVLDASVTPETHDLAVEEVVAPTAPPDPLMEPAVLSEGPRHRLAPRLRTLYVYEAGTLLGADGPHFVASRAGVEQFRIPAGRVDQIEIGPRADVNAGALRLAAAHEIAVSLTDGWGHSNARLETGPSGSARLHVRQAATGLDADRRLAIGRELVAARIANQRALLMRMNRRRKDAEVAAAATALGASLRKLGRATDASALMGYEGEAAAKYWPAFGRCLEHGWRFVARKRRPPPDPVNLVLSILAGRLTTDIDALIRRRGLHPGIGYLHATDESERGTLALDLVEIFRAPLVEGLALYAFNNRVLKEEHFLRDGDRVILTTDGARTSIRAYESWLDRPVRSPFENETVLWRGLIEDQVTALQEMLETGTSFATYRMDY